MPILLMTLSRPFFSGLDVLRARLAGVGIAGKHLVAAHAAMVSNARYGLTAPAPKPMSSARWATSRGSPVSTTRPTRTRLPSRIRWWCTAAVARRLGMAACSRVDAAIAEDEDAGARRRWRGAPRGRARRAPS